MADAEECQEIMSVRLDWTIRGLKELFEASKGETKSKVLKSVKFGGGRWQILFYPNSGTEGGQYVSIYLSCEPTTDEREHAMNGKWTRAGQFKFSFELRNLSKTIIYSQKEASDHTFTWKTANWGWAQFARRESIYYNASPVRTNDAFIITCTISTWPVPPTVSPSIPLRPVPTDLLNAVGSMLDNPAYSDVEFILPSRNTGIRKPRKIYASREILKRAEYFDLMFKSGFAETAPRDMDMSSNKSDLSLFSENCIEASVGQFEDSDDEDEARITESDDGEEEGDDLAQSPAVAKTESEPEEGALSSTIEDTAGEDQSDLGLEIFSDLDPDESNRQPTPSQVQKHDHQGSENNGDSSRSMNVLPNIHDGITTQESNKRYKVVVKDVAYATYRAVLYYLYTDSIVFAPLASTFITPSSTTGPSSSSQSIPLVAQGEGQNLNNALNARSAMLPETVKAGPATRAMWIKEWEHGHPGKPKPCSAKAIYRIADKLGLSDLKVRAIKHIDKSLTIHNIPYEMFSLFSSIFDEVRKKQIAFFLEHWNEIRSSQSMQLVWQQIRFGRHPGFEEVWPLIAMNLEFKPRNSEIASGNQEVKA